MRTLKQANKPAFFIFKACFSVFPVEKLFEFVDENKKLSEIKIGFYKFNGYGEYFKPVGGITKT